MGAPHHDIATRAQVLILLEAKIPISRVSEISGISERQIYCIQKKAKVNGYNSTTSLKTQYLSDAPRSGRPQKITEEMENEIIGEIRASRAGREKTSRELAWKFEISDNSVCKVLHKHGMNSVKPSFKPGLQEDAKSARLRFALDHRYDLEWWKNVIWTDETSIVLGSRRGAV